MKHIDGISLPSTALDNCSICFQDKQMHEKFNSSHTTASSLFDLIHRDVWCPCREKATYGSSYFSLLLMIFLGVFGSIYCLISPKFVLILNNFCVC